MIKNIFFDVMGVVFVVGDDTNKLLVPFVKNFNKVISQEQINKFYLDASLGKITSNEFWLQMGVNENEINIYETKYLNEKLTLDYEIINVIKILKERQYKIGFLSNDVKEWSEHLRKQYNLDSLLDYCIISGDINIRKPDEAIYKYVIQEYQIDPKESIFIDDRINNLIPAEKLGFKTILFDRNNNYDNVNSYNKVHCSSEIVNIIDRLNE